jgi:general secretion pathway protein D
VITVATQGFLDQKTYPAVYDITDLLMEISAFNDPPMIDLRETTSSKPRVSDRADRPWQYGDDDDDEPEEDPARMNRIRKIIDLIESTIAPDSWRDRGGSVGMIKEINGQLVITQNSSGHQRIRGLLSSLREERAIQVSVEALFLTVSSHYLEELGIDLDIVLNAGNAGFDFIDSGSGPLTDPVLGHRLLLPRTFSQLGFTQATQAGGVPMNQVGTAQPFGNVSYIPQPTGGGGSESTPVPIRSSILDITNPASLPSDVPGSFAGTDVGPALSIFGSFLDNIQVDFLIRATQADSRTSVLAAPRLVVFNGGSAWVAVTVQTNFVGSLNPVVAQGAVAQAPVTNTVDAGASLFVRATATADRRYVMLLVAPGVTRLLSLQSFQFSGGTGAFPAFVQLPTLSAQRMQTVVSVPDGGTLLIGGQKLSSETEVEAGVPILSKIPILKRIYSSRTLVKDEQTLLILVKPKILIQSEQEELAFPTFKTG